MELKYIGKIRIYISVTWNNQNKRNQYSILVWCEWYSCCSRCN